MATEANRGGLAHLDSGHCKTLRPELEKLATTFLDSDEVLIAKLNGEAFPEYSYRFGVRGFPTIFWFPARADKPSQEYWGDRHAAALMNWIHTKLEEPNPLKVSRWPVAWRCALVAPPLTPVCRRAGRAGRASA